MPADPPSANQTTAPVPLGQAHPNAQHLPPQPHLVPQHLRYPPQQPAHPLAHHQQPQHLQRQQYAALSSARNLAQMQQPQPHLAQPPPQPQPPQPQQAQPISRQPQRNPLGHQQQPPQQQFFLNGGYGMGGYPVPSQYGLNANYMYHTASYPYNGMQPGNPGQPVPQNPRASRQFSQGVQPPVPQRQPASRVNLPAPRKKAILAIVDPDTNEEVIVSNVDVKPASAAASSSAPSSTTVKIPPRASHALELVSDPADSAKAVADVDKTQQASKQDVESNLADVATVASEVTENKEKPVISPDSSVTAMSTATPPVVVEKPASKEADNSSLLAKEMHTVSPPQPVNAESPVSAPAPTEPTRDEVVPAESAEPVAPAMSTPVHSASGDVVPVDATPAGSAAVVDTSKAGMSRDEEGVMPIDNVITGEAAAKETSASAEVPASLTEASSESPVGSAVEAKIDVVKKETLDESNEQNGSLKTNGFAGSEAIKNETVPDATLETVPAIPPESESVDTPTLGKKEASSSSVTSVDTDVSNPHATPRRERPVFREGDRRVYAPDWMLSMRAAADPKKSAEYVVALTTNNIFKSGPSSANPRSGDLRGSRLVRGSAGPLSADPRGKKAFPVQAGPGFMAPNRGSGAQGMVGSGGVGSYDAFDLRSARSQNPPPVPKGQPGHMRDPRGSRQGGSGRDRFDGPTRHGHGPIDPFVNHAPVEKLTRSEKGWKRDKESDDEVTSKIKQIRSLLNKLTLEKFDRIFKQIIDINISSYEILVGVVKEVFEKALFEPKFSGMYAELCVRLDIATREMLQKSNILDTHGKPVFFRNILLQNCKEEFTRFALASEGSENEAESPKELKEDKKSDAPVTEKEKVVEEALTPEQKKAKERHEKEEAMSRATKAKRRMLANVTFIGELFLKDLLKERIIHTQCIQKLLPIGIEKREEDVLEALCKLLSKTGAKLSENKGAIKHIDGYFNPLEQMSMDHTLPARVRFMLQDLLEQRANNWKVRREEVGAKTIAEIHKDIEKEERAKAEAQAAARERRGRGGGGMHGRDRGPQNFPPRVAMTMASRQKAAGVTRSQAMLEKHASRGSSNAPSSFQGRRLGPPGGSKMNSGTTGSGGPSLRPGGSRYGALAALSETRESSSSNQSGDVRRGGAVMKWQSSSRRPVAVKPEPVVVKPKLMDLEMLKRKTRSILEEFWSNELLKEAKEVLQHEFLPPNYPKFVEEAVKFSMDAKTAQREKSVPLFVGLLGDLIPGKVFIGAFLAVIAQLADIEMDNPRASDFLAVYIGAAAATKKLGSEKGDALGLNFLKSGLMEVSDGKRASKLTVCVFAEVYRRLQDAIPDEDERKAAVKNGLKVLDVDLAGKMSEWNPMRGVSVLQSMLSEQGIAFALPILPVELRLKEVLEGKPSVEEVRKTFASSGTPDGELRSEEFIRMVIRVSFNWLFMDPPASIKESFGSLIGNPLVQRFGGEIPRDVQMAALLETQSFIIKNLDFLPAHKEGDTDKPGNIAFECLYDADVVEEDAFLRWKEDTDKSTKVEGKDKMIIQTSGFFRWLGTAEVEE